MDLLAILSGFAVRACPLGATLILLLDRRRGAYRPGGTDIAHAVPLTAGHRMR